MNGIGLSSSSASSLHSPLADQSDSGSPAEKRCDDGVKIAHRHVREYIESNQAVLNNVMKLLKAKDYDGAREIFYDKVDNCKLAVGDVTIYIKELFVNQMEHFDLEGYECLSYFCQFVNQTYFIKLPVTASYLFCELEINKVKEFLFLDKILERSGSGCRLFRKKIHKWASRFCNKFLDDIIQSPDYEARDLNRFLEVFKDHVTNDMIGGAISFLVRNWTKELAVSKIFSLFEYFCKMELLNIAVNQVKFEVVDCFDDKGKCLLGIVCTAKKFNLNDDIFFQFYRREKIIEVREKTIDRAIKEIKKNKELRSCFHGISEKDIKGLVYEVLDAAVDHFVEVFFSGVPVQRRKEVCLNLLSSVKSFDDLDDVDRLIGILCIGISSESNEDLRQGILDLFQKNKNMNLLLEVCKTARDIGTPIDNEFVIIEFHHCLMASSWHLAIRYLNYGLIERMEKNNFLQVINCIGSIVDGYANCNDLPILDFKSAYKIYRSYKINEIAEVLERLIRYIVDSTVDAELINIVNKCMLNVIRGFVGELECLIANKEGCGFCSLVFGMIIIYEKKLNQRFYNLLSDSLKLKVKSIILSKLNYVPELLQFAIFSQLEGNHLICRICNESKDYWLFDYMKRMDILLNEATRTHIQKSLEKYPLEISFDISEDRRQELLSIPESQTIKAFYEEQERLKVTGR